MKNKIIAILQRVLQEPVDETTSRTSARNWDSINHIRIVMEIKDELELEIGADHIDSLSSVGKIMAFVEKASSKPV